jgi:hypothetical protein
MPFLDGEVMNPFMDDPALMIQKQGLQIHGDIFFADHG